MVWKPQLTEAGMLVFPFTFALPIPLIYKSIALGIFCLTMLLTYLLSQNGFPKLPKYNLHLFYLLFYLIVTATIFLREGLLYFDDTRLPFLVLPLLMPLTPELFRKHSDKILKAFLAGVLTYIAYSIVFLIYFYGWYNPNKAFELDYYLKYVLYHYMPGAIHHTYLGLFITFSVVIVLEMKKLNKALKISSLVLLCLSLPLLGSKWSLLAGVIILTRWTLIYANFKARKWQFALILLFAAVLIWVGMVTDLFRTVFQSMEKRIQIFQCSFEGAHEFWVLGMGKDSLKLWMENCTNSNLAMDTHNIFLQELLTSGILGLLILIIIIAGLFRESSNYFAFRMFWFLIVFFGLIEHLLNLQLGVTFFVFFSMLFLGMQNSKQHIVINQEFEQ